MKKMLLRFMVKPAAEKLKPVMSKSAATRSRAGTTLSIDNSVMDRCGRLLRCTWSWYSGRYHQVIRGQDLLGIVLTIHHIAFPLHLLFCPKQGRYHTTKADLLIFMLTQLKTAFLREGIDTDFSVVLYRSDSMLFSEKNHVKVHKNQWIQAMPHSPEYLAGAARRGQTTPPEGQKPSQWLCLTKLPREMCPQLIVSKALSWGIIRKSACLLADITLRKSQSCGEGHGMLLCSVWVCGDGSLSKYL